VAPSNLQVARRLFPAELDLAEAVARPAALRAALEPIVHPDFEIVGAPDQLPLMGTGAGSSPGIYIGIDGFVAGFRDWLSTWDSWIVAHEELIEVDKQRVLVLIRVAARSRTHGVEMPIEAANLLTIVAGRVSRLELFFNRAQARKAAGLA
jgi:hypothetical protein